MTLLGRLAQAVEENDTLADVLFNNVVLEIELFLIRTV